MKIVIGGDHCGFELKTQIRPIIEALGCSTIDVGCYDDTPCDFPDITAALTSKILSGEAERGILFCGTGIGAAMSANKVPGIRAAICHDFYCAHQGVEQVNVNVMCIGGEIVGARSAADIIKAFLESTFEAYRPEFARRQNQLAELEKAWTR